MKTWNKKGSLKLLLTIVKTLTFASSTSGIRMPNPGSIIGELRRSSVWEEKIISKILLPPSLRTSCGRIRSWRVKGS